MPESPIVFGSFSYDDATGTLWRDARPIPLGARASALLGALLRANGSVVPRDVLIEAAWAGAAVEDGNLAVQIAGLRKTLGRRDSGEEWIATVARVGYRLQRAETAAAGGKPALAVLPFITMSDDPDQEYVADGIVEDLITAFSRFRNLGVIARQSSFAYKNREFDARDAARALGVRYLLEGSVRRSGDRMRVTAQLIDGTSGEHIWAEKLDGLFDDIFDFQDRVTSAVVGIIEPEIRKAEIVRAIHKHPSSLDAYDLYWRALPLLQSWDASGYSEAVDLLDRAVELEPEFGPILAHAAYAHDKRLGSGNGSAGVDDAAIAIDLSARAMAADSSDPFSVLVAGMIEGTKGNRQAAVAMARSAYDLNPNHVLICNITGWLNWTVGNYDEAIACSLRALQLSPVAPEQFWSLSAIARSHLSAGRFEEALLWSLRAIERNPQFEQPREIVIACYAHLGQLEDARQAFIDLVGLQPGTTIDGLLAKFEGPHYQYQREGIERLGSSAATGLRTFNTA